MFGALVVQRDLLLEFRWVGEGDGKSERRVVFASMSSYSLTPTVLSSTVHTRLQSEKFPQLFIKTDRLLSSKVLQDHVSLGLFDGSNTGARTGPTWGPKSGPKSWSRKDCETRLRKKQTPQDPRHPTTRRTVRRGLSARWGDTTVGVRRAQSGSRDRLLLNEIS